MKSSDCEMRIRRLAHTPPRRALTGSAPWCALVAIYQNRAFKTGFDAGRQMRIPGDPIPEAPMAPREKLAAEILRAVADELESK